MAEKYRNIKCLVSGLDCTAGKVYATLRVSANWVTYIDDAGEEGNLAVSSLMLGKWEPTDEEVSV